VRIRRVDERALDGVSGALGNLEVGATQRLGGFDSTGSTPDQVRAGFSGSCSAVCFRFLRLVDGSELRCISQRLRENGNDASGFAAFPASVIAVRGNEEYSGFGYRDESNNDEALFEKRS
jgi:hypothetical protein